MISYTLYWCDRKLAYACGRVAVASSVQRPHSRWRTSGSSRRSWRGGGDEEPLERVAGARSGGDERALRGLPAIGRGVSGTMPGTDPVQAAPPQRVALLEGRRQTPKVVEAAVLLSCGCGAQFELSARNARNHRVNGTQPKCRDCRYGHDGAPRATEAMRRWWLSRYSIDEIRELGRHLDTFAGSDARVRGLGLLIHGRGHDTHGSSTGRRKPSPQGETRGFGPRAAPITSVPPFRGGVHSGHRSNAKLGVTLERCLAPVDHLLETIGPEGLRANRRAVCPPGNLNSLVTGAQQRGRVSAPWRFQFRRSSKGHAGKRRIPGCGVETLRSPRTLHGTPSAPINTRSACSHP